MHGLCGLVSCFITQKNLVVVSNIFLFHPYLGRWSNLTSIFFRWVETTNQKNWGEAFCQEEPCQGASSSFRQGPVVELGRCDSWSWDSFRGGPSTRNPTVQKIGIYVHCSSISYFQHGIFQHGGLWGTMMQCVQTLNLQMCWLFVAWDLFWTWSYVWNHHCTVGIM